MISFNSQFSYNQNSNVKFGAIPRAEYRTLKNKKVKIYELEKKDLPFIRNFSNNIDTYISKNRIEGKSRQEIIKTSFKVAEELLNVSDKKRGKNHIFIAEAGADISGVLIVNMPKRTPNGKKIYSSRKNCSRKETELNWFATWNNKNKDIKGIGKMLIGEFYNSLKKDRFKKVFVESEIPEKTYAEFFYQKMGFKELTDHRKTISQVETNKDVIKNSGSIMENDEIVPMIVKKNNINRVKEQIFSIFKRKTLSSNSIDLYDVIK